MTIDLSQFDGMTPGPLPVARAQHGSDHYTIGPRAPFVAVAKRVEDANGFSKIHDLIAEVRELRAALAFAVRAESLFVEYTSDGRIDPRNPHVADLCAVFSEFQRARTALAGGAP